MGHWADVARWVAAQDVQKHACAQGKKTTDRAASWQTMHAARFAIAAVVGKYPVG